MKKHIIRLSVFLGLLLISAVLFNHSYPVHRYKTYQKKDYRTDVIVGSFSHYDYPMEMDLFDYHSGMLYLDDAVNLTTGKELDRYSIPVRGESVHAVSDAASTLNPGTRIIVYSDTERYGPDLFHPFFGMKTEGNGKEEIVIDENTAYQNYMAFAKEQIIKAAILYFIGCLIVFSVVLLCMHFIEKKCRCREEYLNARFGTKKMKLKTGDGSLS